MWYFLALIAISFSFFLTPVKSRDTCINPNGPAAFYRLLAKERAYDVLTNAIQTPIGSGECADVVELNFEGCISALKCPFREQNLRNIRRGRVSRKVKQSIEIINHEVQILSMFQGKGLSVVELYGNPFSDIPGYEHCYTMKRYTSDLLQAKLHLDHSWLQIAQFALDIVNTVIAIHEEALLLNDLKAQNIFYSRPDDEVVIADFGLVDHESLVTGISPLYSGNEHRRTRANDAFSFGQVLKIMVGVTREQLKHLAACSRRFTLSLDRVYEILGRGTYGRDMHERFSRHIRCEALPAPSVPEGVPDELIQIYLDATQLMATKRPTFPNMQVRLTKLIRRLNGEPPLVEAEPADPFTPFVFNKCLRLQNTIRSRAEKYRNGVPYVDFRDIQFGSFQGFLNSPGAKGGVFDTKVYKNCDTFVYAADQIPDALFERNTTTFYIPGANGVGRRTINLVGYSYALHDLKEEDVYEDYLIFQDVDFEEGWSKSVLLEKLQEMIFGNN